MAPPLLGAIGALAAAAVVLLATPGGVWLTARAAEWGAGSRGWSLRIGETGGVLVASPRFGDLRAELSEGLEARADELVLHPWDWRLSLRAPEVRWRPRAGADTAATVGGPGSTSAAPLLLPVADLPRIDVAEGAFELFPEDGPSAAFRGIEAHLVPGESPSEAVLDLLAESWSVVSDSTLADGRLSTRWRLAPGEMDLEEARIAWRTAVGQGTATGSGRVDLGRALAFALHLGLEGGVGSMQVDTLEIAARGTASPVRIEVRAHGEGREPSLGDVGLALAGRLDSSGIRADSLRLGVAGGSLVAGGLYRSGPGSLGIEIDFREVDLGRLPVEGFGGTAQGRVTVDGALDSPRASLGLRVAAMEGIAPGAVDLALEGSLEDETLRLTARSPQLGELTATGGLSLEGYDLRLEGGLDVGRWIGSELPASVRGRWRPEMLDVRLQSERLPYGLDLPGPLTADASLRQFRHLDLALRLGTGRLSAHLRTDLASPELDTLSAAVLGLDLSRLASMVEGTAAGTGSVEGLLGAAGRGGVQLRVDDLRLAGWSLGPTAVDADYAEGAVELTATAPGLDVRARVDTAGRAQGSASLRNAVLRRVGAPDSLRVLGGLAAASGDLHDPLAGSLQVRIDGASGSLGGWPVSLGAPSVLEYAEGRGLLKPSRVRTPLGEVSVRARFEDGHLDLTAGLDSVESTGLAGLTARGRALLRAAGDLTDPDLALRADLEEVALRGRSIGAVSAALDLGDSLLAHLQLRQDTSSAGQLVLRLESPASVVEGEAADGDSLKMRLRAEGLDASWLATHVLDDSTGLRLSAEADLSLPANRVFERFGWTDAVGSLRLGELVLERERLRLRLQQPASVRLDPGRPRIEGFELPVLVFRRDPGLFEEAGTLVVEGGRDQGAGGIRLSLADLDLEAVTLAVPGCPALPAGRLDGSLELVPRHDGVSVGSEALVELDGLGYLEAGLSSGTGRGFGRAAWVTPVEDSLVVTAGVPLADGRPLWEGLSLTARSEGIDLLILLDLVPLESLSGRVRLDLAADSLHSRPRIAGQVEVEDLGFSLIDVRPGYRFPGGRLVLAPKAGGGTRGELVDIEGRPTRGDGRVRMEGWLDLASVDEIDYEVRLSGRVPYNYSDSFAAPRVDVDLALTGEPEGSLVKGSIALDRSQSEIQLVELTTPVPPPPAVQDPLLGGVGMDVYVDIVELKSRSELSDIDVDGRVRVYGTFYKPRFQGELEVTEGTVILLSRPFVFSPGGRVVLDKLVPTYSILDLFHEPILLDPEFDLEAVARVQVADENEEREVTLSLEGTVLSPSPELTSLGLTERQIFMLLAFGTIEEDQFNYSGALYTTAGQLLLGRRVQEAGLDEFLLLPSGTAQGTIGETTMRIGKRLTWPLPMWVRYEAVTKEPSLGQFEVEYGITSWLRLEATAHSQYELYGLGLEVSRDF
ncbi:MAG: translocation/assembly module TamB domain-containing protein [Gemmatimonadaceae bacterium]|nr:translocation/assembly module TamB domain-containing protein [Gemmatimonadaceae bacterium]